MAQKKEISGLSFGTLSLLQLCYVVVNVSWMFLVFDVLVKELRSENYTNSFDVILLNDVAGKKELKECIWKLVLYLYEIRNKLQVISSGTRRYLKEEHELLQRKGGSHDIIIIIIMVRRELA